MKAVVDTNQVQSVCAFFISWAIMLFNLAKNMLRNIVLLLVLLIGLVAIMIPGPASGQDLAEKSHLFLRQQLKNNFILGFKIPDCDPLSKSNLGNRVFIYDTALAIIAFKMQDDHESSTNLVAAIKPFINADNGVDFSYDAEGGSFGMKYIRSGAVAWLGYALVYAEQIQLATQLADFLLGRQVMDKNDPRSGLFRGGFGLVRQNDFVDTEIQWVSTEHNIDIYFFLRDLGLKLRSIDRNKSERFLSIAHELKHLIVERLWDKNENRFLRGIGIDGLDTEKVLDAQTWGALFLSAIGNKELALKSLEYASNNFKVKRAKVLLNLDDTQRLNCKYNCPDLSISGFKPYLESKEYKNNPEVIWSEGTLGFILAAHRLKVPAINEWLGMQSLSRCGIYGGLLQATETHNQIPYEIHTWESVASTIWSLFVILDRTLPEDKQLWASDQSLQWME